MATTIRLVAQQAIALPHRIMNPGDSLDFGNPKDYEFFVSRLRWSAFKVEQVTDGQQQPQPQAQPQQSPQPFDSQRKTRRF